MEKEKGRGYEGERQFYTENKRMMQACPEKRTYIDAGNKRRQREKKKKGTFCIHISRALGRAGMRGKMTEAQRIKNRVTAGARDKTGGKQKKGKRIQGVEEPILKGWVCQRRSNNNLAIKTVQKKKKKEHAKRESLVRSRKQLRDKKG